MTPRWRAASLLRASIANRMHDGRQLWLGHGYQLASKNFPHPIRSDDMMTRSSSWQTVKGLKSQVTESMICDLRQHLFRAKPGRTKNPCDVHQQVRQAIRATKLRNDATRKPPKQSLLMLAACRHGPGRHRQEADTKLTGERWAPQVPPERTPRCLERPTTMLTILRSPKPPRSTRRA
jgi:hypothetical protein